MFVKVLRIKAILLMFVFLFGGNGLSIDVAQCCNSFTGVSLSFGQHKEHVSKGDDCCACLRIQKKNRACCEDVVFQTVINQALSIEKNTVSINKIKKAETSPVILSVQILSSQLQSRSFAFYPQSEISSQVPILIQKRVLQI